VCVAAKWTGLTATGARTCRSIVDDHRQYIPMKPLEHAKIEALRKRVDIQTDFELMKEVCGQQVM
jgi:hypothetical protein